MQGHCDKHNLSAAPKQGNTFNNVLGRLIHPPHRAGLTGCGERGNLHMQVCSPTQQLRPFELKIPVY